jgi:hypothetical protein
MDLFCGDAGRTFTIIDMTAPRTPGTRAKDSDRVEICRVLDTALGDGQLSMDEHDKRVSAATDATTLGELYSLVADLQTTPAHPPGTQPWERLRKRRSVVAAAVVALVVVVVVIGWGVWANTGSPTNATKSDTAAPQTHALAAEPSTQASPTTKAEQPDDVPAVVLPPPRQLLSADGITSVIDAMRKRFGDATGYELAITPDEAMLGRPDPADDHSKLIYEYHGGWGDPSSRSKSDTDDVADLGAFDVAAAAAAVAKAPETLKIAPDDVEGTFLDIDQVPNPPGPGALELLIKITTKSDRSGLVYLDGAGNIKRVENPG